MEGYTAVKSTDLKILKRPQGNERIAIMCTEEMTLACKLTASVFYFRSVILLSDLNLQHAFLYKVEVEEVESCLLISHPD